MAGPPASPFEAVCWRDRLTPTFAGAIHRRVRPESGTARTIPDPCLTDRVETDPHLFIFYTTNNYTHSGDNLGGYNRDVAGWQQVSTTVYPGMQLAESKPGGAQYDITIKVQLSLGNWWVRIGNEWMGYYPNGLYSPSGLRDQAASVDWGGEIVDDKEYHPEPTSTWMGSGLFPNTGYSNAAYMRNLAYQSDTAGTMVPIQGFPAVTNPAAYQIATDFSGATTWGSNFFWGGPGGVP